MTSQKRVVIIGCNFAGLAAATTLKDLVRSRHDVTVISRTDRFVFHPSLARLALGVRTVDQAVFPVGGVLAERGIAFRKDTVMRLDLERRRVVTRTTEERYDYLVLATGAKPNYGAVPGLGPRGYTQSITGLAEAEQARSALENLLRTPGPVVIGDVQGSPCRRPAYEFLLNLRGVLERRRLSGAAPLTWLTAGPGAPASGWRLEAHASVAEIVPGEIRLADGRALPFSFSMLLPSFLGVDAVRASEKITDAAGFVRVNGLGQTSAYPEVFAAGAAVAGEPPEKPGAVAERMAQRVARNIGALLLGEPMIAEAPAAEAEAPAAPGSGAGEWIDSGPEAVWSRAAFERYFHRAG